MRDYEKVKLVSSLDKILQSTVEVEEAFETVEDILREIPSLDNYYEAIFNRLDEAIGLIYELLSYIEWDKADLRKRTTI